MTQYAMDRLLAIMRQLRDPESGCPWDRKQTFASIVPHTLEEAYELAWAIEHGQRADIQQEMGDLLFQVVFYCQMAQEQGWFDFNQVAQTLEEKLVRRHPHVFSNQKVSGAEEVSHLWESIKEQERDSTSLLEDIPKNLPSLSRAQKIQKRVTQVGFDWESIEQVFAKVEEEVQELKHELHVDPKKAAEELGDLMFTCCNLARWLGQDAEQLMRTATDKFVKRFNKVEDKVKASLKPWDHYDAEALVHLWGEAKNDD